MPTTLQELKASSPAYAAMGDMEFASKVYRTHYADKMDFPTFAKRVGFDPYGDAKPRDPTEGMSGFDKFMAGAGRSVAETGRGLKQIYAWATDQVAPRAPEMSDLITHRDPSRSAAVQREIDEARRTDAPLLDTGWGTAGNIAGSIAQLYTPGAALRGTIAARSLLPTTIRGNALQGAVLGALQPTATGESRTGNTLAGGAFGAGGAALVRGGAAALGGLRNMLAGSGVSSVDRAAAERLVGEAGNPASLSAAAPSLVPGVRRTLAEESRDEGMARLEQTLRGQPGFNWGARDATANAARLAALERIAGTDADMAAAKTARAAAASGARTQAMAAGPVDIATTVAQLDSAIEGQQGRPAVQGALQQLKALLIRDAKAGTPEDRIAVLDNVRMTIGDMLSGKFGGENAAALRGSKELIAIRDALNDNIGEQVPAFTEYLDAFRQGSVPINRMEVGRELIDGSTPSVLTDAAGNRSLSPAQFSKRARDLDAAAARATGFAKAKATDILTPADIAMVKAIQDDLERQAFAATKGTGGNSASAARAGVLSRLGSRAGNAVASIVPYGAQVKSLMQVLDEKGAERINQRLAYLVANPEEARRVLAALPPAGRQIVAKALTALAGTAGGGIGVTAAAQDQPLELDIIGGTPGAAPTAAEMATLRRRRGQSARAAY